MGVCEHVCESMYFWFLCLTFVHIFSSWLYVYLHLPCTCVIELYVTRVPEAPYGVQQGRQTFFFHSIFSINVKHGLRKLFLFRLFRFIPHSFPKTCAFPCSNLLHKWTYWCKTNTRKNTHRHT